VVAGFYPSGVEALGQVAHLGVQPPQDSCLAGALLAVYESAALPVLDDAHRHGGRFLVIVGQVQEALVRVGRAGRLFEAERLQTGWLVEQLGGHTRLGRCRYFDDLCSTPEKHVREMLSTGRKPEEK
jgi:hypothetical protein